MALSNGPKLGILIDGEQGEEHYEALMKQWRALDALIQCTCIAHTLTSPPSTPADGDVYVIQTDSPSGAWSGQANKIARWSSKISAWEFYTPKPGWQAWSNEIYNYLYFRPSGVWAPFPVSETPPVTDGPYWAVNVEGTLQEADTILVQAGYFGPPARAVGYPQNSGKRYIEFMSPSSYSEGSTGLTVGLAASGFKDGLLDGSSWSGYWNIAATGYGFYYKSDGVVEGYGGVSESVATYAVDDAVGFCVDLDAGLFWPMRNGVALVGDPVAGTGGLVMEPGINWYPWAGLTNENRAIQIFADYDYVNYLPPSGFTAWHTP